MSKRNKRSIISYLVQAVGVLCVLVLLAPATLYIPWVQNIAKDYACEYASKETGMKISLERILLKFPLDVSVDSLIVRTGERDTMAHVGNLTASLAVKPLLSLDIELDEALLEDGRYRMISEDSSMVLRADLQMCKVKGVEVDIDNHLFNIIDGKVRGGDVRLDYYPYKVVNECDTTEAEESKPWKIQAFNLVVDDVNYNMMMLPTIDKMQVHVTHLTLANGIVDTGEHKVDAQSLKADSLSVKYLYPTEFFQRKFALDHPVPVDTCGKNKSELDTVPWTIKADTLHLKGASATYALSNKQPRRGRGLNNDCIEVENLDLDVYNLYNRDTDVALSLKHLTLDELGSGLRLQQGEGNIALNSREVKVEKLKLKTLMSDINLDARLDLSMVDNPYNGQVRFNTDCHIAMQDVVRLLPAYAPMLNTIPHLAPIAIKGNASGNARRLDIGTLTAELPRYARATVKGTVINPTDLDKLVADIDIDGRFDNIRFIKPTLLDKALQEQIDFPPMSLVAHAKVENRNIAAEGSMTLASGKMVGKGTFNANSETYTVDATFTNFPVKAIAPLSEVDELTAHVVASGNGFDFMSPGTNIDAQVDLAGINYSDSFYENLTADVKLHGGQFDGFVSSANDNCRVNINAHGLLDDGHYIVDAVGDIEDLDLNALGAYDGECNGHGSIVAHGDIDLVNSLYDAKLDIRNLDWTFEEDHFVAESVQAIFHSDEMSTSLVFDNEDNHIDFASETSIDELIGSFSESYNIAMEQYEQISINIDTLQEALPPFTFNVKMGTDGLVQRYMQKFDVDFKDVNLDMRNDSVIFIDGYVRALSVKGTNVDTLTLKASQWNRYLAFKAHMGNRPGTMDDFAQVSLVGGVKGATIDFLALQHNIHNEMGYRIGCNATLTDTALNMKLFPKEPVIGYRKWEINDSNYVNYNYGTRMLDADVKLLSDSSLVALNTSREPGDTTENIKLNINNLRIEEWTKFMPNLDPMTGVLNADMDVAFDGHGLDGKGVIDLNNFVYNGMREGDFKITTDYDLDPVTHGTRVNADMLVDGSHVALAYGSLSEAAEAIDGNTLNLAMKLDRFPLSKVSPFIPGRMVWLKGYLQGDVKVEGSMDTPILNGSLVADSAYVTLPRFGSSLKLCDDKLEVTDNLISFNGYRIMGLNNKPVTVNGCVDFQDTENPVIDLQLDGTNVQFIGSEQRTFSEMFGKGYADIAASLISREGSMDMRADLALLTGSNLTYVLQDELSNLTSSIDENMVTFVNLNDSTGGATNLITKNGTTSTNIVANLEVQQGAKINAFLSPDGKDRATIDGSGKLRYSLDFAGKSVLTGTYTIESGSFRYSPPLISQKNFVIVPGSTVVWTGDMLNPQLNISATENVKTSVSMGDQGSRLVDFLITANVGGTLGVIKLDFDMSAVGDMTVQNELQSMTDVQRSQAAINLLLYNTYSGSNSTAAPNNITASTALFSFVQSQLNNWAGKMLKGVDLSFGINQYEAGSGHGLETSYSYRLSKNLFNDRFKIVVGGEYSTDASAEVNFAQNLLNDISFEYSLNNTGSRYVRLFRNMGYESILEGQVTKTGVGFVMKYKVNDLKSLFRFKPFRPVLMDTTTTPAVAPEATESNTQNSDKQ